MHYFKEHISTGQIPKGRNVETPSFFFLLSWLRQGMTVAQAGLKLTTILLSLSPKCWDYTCEPTMFGQPDLRFGMNRYEVI